MTKYLLSALIIAGIVLAALVIIKGGLPSSPPQPTIVSQPDDTLVTQSTTTTNTSQENLDKITEAAIAESQIEIIPARDYNPDITPSSKRAQAIIIGKRPQLIRAFSAKKLQFGAPIFIRIFKAEKTLEVWVENGEKYEHFKTYPIAAFSGKLGPKLTEGDRQAPEGFYFVPPRALNPNSQFHLSFNLGYPNKYDLAHNRTGSALMVHGSNVSIGCYAMTDAGIEEIYTIADAALGSGQAFFRVHIFPFHLTEANLRRHTNNKNIAFWRNLKGGYDAFEQTHRPPDAQLDEEGSQIKYRFRKI